MKTIQTIALASVSLITSVSSASTSIISCIDFEDLSSGSIYAPVSNFVTNNIDVLITPHPMGTAFQGELVTNVPAPMGSGNRLWTNNVAAEFSAPSSGFGLATKASFKYAYMGGELPGGEWIPHHTVDVEQFWPLVRIIIHDRSGSHHHQCDGRRRSGWLCWPSRSHR